MDIFLFVLFILLGWLCGVIVNHLANVLPGEAMNPLSAPSCPACGRLLPLWQTALFPARCPGCQRLPLRGWLVLFVYMLALPLARLYLPGGLNLLTFILILLFFGVVWVIDVEHRLIVTPVLLAGGAFCLWGGVQLHGWAYSLIGGLTALVVLLAIHLLGVVFVRLMSLRRGEQINETAFASGDVALGSVIGLLLGFPDILRGLVYTILIAGAVSLVWLAILLVRRQYQLGSAIPYAPFLICGALIVLLF